MNHVVQPSIIIVEAISIDKFVKNYLINKTENRNRIK